MGVCQVYFSVAYIACASSSQLSLLFSDKLTLAGLIRHSADVHKGDLCWPLSNVNSLYLDHTLDMQCQRAASHMTCVMPGCLTQAPCLEHYTRQLALNRHVRNFNSTECSLLATTALTFNDQWYDISSGCSILLYDKLGVQLCTFGNW